MIDVNNLKAEDNYVDEQRTWVFQVTLLVNKDLESGLVESTIKGLDKSVRVLEFAKKEVINQQTQ